MLENKKSLFKPLNKDFIRIKCCEFCRTFCRTTKFFIIKTSSLILRNAWGSNGALTRHVCEIVRTKKYLFSTLKCSHINSLQELYQQTVFLTIFNVT